MGMSTLTRDDIKNIIDMPDLSTEEICQVIKKELNIEIEPSLDKSEMVDEVYNAYQLALQEIENKKNEAKVEKTKIKVTTGFNTTVKEFILNLIKENKHTKKDIIDITNTERGYAAKGSTCKTRVSRVVRELIKQGKLKVAADGIYKYEE
jgi:lysine/ornithine N-monooxygenase